jgi:hypothetical protein
MVNKHQRMKQATKRSEKPIGQTNMRIETRDIKWKKRYYDKSEQVLKK